jgi:hypothetical protein
MALHSARNLSDNGTSTKNSNRSQGREDRCVPFALSLSKGVNGAKTAFPFPE